MSHTITITGVPSEEVDDYSYEFGGTHDAKCEFYKECTRDWHRHPKDPEMFEDGWSTKRAPQPHLFLDGAWMVPEDQNKRCALEFVFEGYTPEEVLEGMKLGETRDVYCDWDGEGWSLVVTVPPEECTLRHVPGYPCQRCGTVLDRQFWKDQG